MEHEYKMNKQAKGLHSSAKSKPWQSAVGEQASVTNYGDSLGGSRTKDYYSKTKRQMKPQLNDASSNTGSFSQIKEIGTYNEGSGRQPKRYPNCGPGGSAQIQKGKMAPKSFKQYEQEQYDQYLEEDAKYTFQHEKFGNSTGRDFRPTSSKKASLSKTFQRGGGSQRDLLSSEKTLQPYLSPIDPFQQYQDIYESISYDCQVGLKNFKITLDKQIKLNAADPLNQKITNILGHRKYVDYTNHISSQILYGFNTNKYDIVELLQRIIEDMHELNKSVLRYKTNLFNSTESKIYCQYLLDQDQPNSMAQIDCMEQNLSMIVTESLDYVLKFKRNFMKGLTQQQTSTICETILSILMEQDQMIESLQKMTCEGQEVQKGQVMIAFRTISDENFRECCLRFIGQLCFENSPNILDTTIKILYEYSSKIAFQPESVYFQQKNQASKSMHKNVNSFFYKTLRAAFNCIANLLTQEMSVYVRQNNATIFKKLRKEFEYMMSKIHHYHRSKRFISQMTTVIRALQFSMNFDVLQNQIGNNLIVRQGTTHQIFLKSKQGGLKDNQSNSEIGEIKLPDNEAVVMFIYFYKLLFLGSKFAKKILKIKVEQQSHANGAKFVIDEQGMTTDEEGKMSDGSQILTDLSDINSSDFQNDLLPSYDDKTHEGQIQTQDGDLDPYQKIKIHANLALRNLVKNNCKILFNYWYMVFPSLMFRQRSDFYQYMYSVDDPEVLQEFKSKILNHLETQEPTFFFVIRQPSSQSQLRSSIYQTIQVMIENSGIQRIQTELESDKKENKPSKAIFQMTDVLGQFLRFMHYILVCSLNEGSQTAHLYPTNPKNQEQKPSNSKIQVGQYFDRQTYIKMVKLLQTLIQMTPYHLMKRGLATITIHALIENIQILDNINNRDQLIRNEICAAINQALSKTELISELKANFFDHKKQSYIETLLSTLFKVQNITSNEKIQLLQTIGKNYPEVLTLEWLKTQDGHAQKSLFKNQIPKIQKFLLSAIEKIDQRKLSQVLKILEELLKNYQVLVQEDNNDEKVIHTTDLLQLVEHKRLSPYDNPEFCKFLYELIEKQLFMKDIVDEQTLQTSTQQYHKGGPQGKPVINLEVNTSISILNIICIMNSEQYQKVFRHADQTMKLLNFLDSILNIHILYPKHLVQIPSIMKAAVIKTFGYLIQHQKGANKFTETDYVCNNILGLCLSKQIMNDTNTNVQIRTSWTLSFICSLYPIENIILSKSAHNEKLHDHPDQLIKYNLDLIINSCIKFVQLSASNKEKVAASSIRALGFVIQNLIMVDHRQKVGGPEVEVLIAEKEIEMYIRQIIEVITSRFYNTKQCSPKVLWNLCVMLSKIIDKYNELFTEHCSVPHPTYLGMVFNFQTTKCLLGIFMEGQNYKTKIHAVQTLMKFKNLQQYGYLDCGDIKDPENLLELFWKHIQDQLKFQINYNQIPTSNLDNASIKEQIAYIQQIDKSFIEFWAHICDLTRISLSNPCLNDYLNHQDGSHHQSIMIDYFNKNSFDILQSLIKYLQRELKVPQYFWEDDDEFKKEDFDKETELIFQDQPKLLSKLELLQKHVIKKIFDIMDQDGSEIRVSLLVYTSFKTLTDTEIKDLRGLEMLKIQRANFDPKND